MSDVPDLAALRRERVASDAEYIKQLEQFSLGQERELGRLRAVAFLCYRTLSDEPIETLAWLTPEHRELLAQVVSDLGPHLNPERARTAMQDVVDERDRLRAHRNRLVESLESMKNFVHGDTHRKVVAERNELRAVVEATRKFIAAQVDADSTPEEDLAAWNAMIDAFHQLDGSAEVTDG